MLRFTNTNKLAVMAVFAVLISIFISSQQVCQASPVSVHQRQRVLGSVNETVLMPVENHQLVKRGVSVGFYAKCLITYCKFRSCAPFRSGRKRRRQRACFKCHINVCMVGPWSG